MKKYIKLFILVMLFISGVVVLHSCKTSSLTLNILVPADISIPQSIQTVVIANRTLPAEDKKVVNVIEGVITGESIFADREGSENCVRGLANKLNTSPRFNAKLIENSTLRGTGTREWPAPLAWSEVEKLCNQYNADALILLEAFDSDNRLNEFARDVKRKVDGREVVVKEFVAEMFINVYAGWRIYDYKNQVVIDKNSFMDTKSWSGVGNNPDQARNRLPSKRHMINEAGVFSGSMYGVRISPSWMRASRIYYSGKDDRFKTAKRYVETNDWEEAMNIWLQIVDDPEPKTAGRACFNMGIGNEVLGNLDDALEWFKRSYQDYGDKNARKYIGIIEGRIYDQKRLDEQMGE
jgi:hypothetical protein